ncbi:MAG: short-chain dehydrogenase/reductase family oxidoreductase [Polyangiaceae bacterium]|nr:short-chain dehydrogenase/reductase family oxidoreductase [Polyangiaceae bacterium]
MARGQVQGRVAVVTGAGRGIGRATVLELARRGAHVAGCDTDLPALETTMAECAALGARTLSVRVDVADAAAVAGFAERVEAELGPSYCVVSNAGVGVGGGFFDTPDEDWEWLLRVNLWGTIHVARAFAPLLRARGQGRIVNVASASGFCNLPSLAAYGTTKYAVVGLSEALRAELLPDGVTVSVVCPALVRTSILDRARIRGALDEQSERRALKALYERRGVAPELVAKAVVNAAESGRALVPVSTDAWVLYAMKRLAPSALPWLLRASERLYRKK